ncbi:hypothetical protein DFH06DRAFT_1136188 [Mycena polygramma]|nr:hypothetical protein DFH06DRAFT_1136188 [Mycena polygramma]
MGLLANSKGTTRVAFKNIGVFSEGHRGCPMQCIVWNLAPHGSSLLAYSSPRQRHGASATASMRLVPDFFPTPTFMQRRHAVPGAGYIRPSGHARTAARGSDGSEISDKLPRND